MGMAFSYFPYLSEWNLFVSAISVNVIFLVKLWDFHEYSRVMDGVHE